MTYQKFIPMEVPRTTFQAKMPVRIGEHARIIDKPAAQAMKKQLYLLFYQHRPEQVLKGPMIVRLRFIFQAAKSPKFQGLRPRVRKPDIDNLSKGFIDAMVKGQWIENDQSICKLSATKWDSHDPSEWGVEATVNLYL
jgi:Holliday junction resolvase RusA-like endonuclease